MIANSNAPKFKVAAEKVFKKVHSVDVYDKLSNEEAIHLRHIYDANFETRLTPHAPLLEYLALYPILFQVVNVRLML